MIDLILMAVSASVGAITAYFIFRWDRKLTRGLAQIDEVAGPFADIGETIQATLESPEAVGSLIDRAVSTAVLTWQRSNAGQLGGDSKLAKGAGKQVRAGIQQFVTAQNPLVGMLIEQVMGYAQDWIGPDPDGRRSSAVWDQLVKMGMGMAGQLDSSSLAQPKKKNPYE